jgi:diguanylate cyclase (GGDEF)-like protein
MFFNSIKTTLITLTVSAILVASTLVLFFSIVEHEKLYREVVRSDLDGLSENLSNDLVALMTHGSDGFDIAALLLRLDRYENVMYAEIYDPNFKLLKKYFGRASGEVDKQNISPSQTNLDAMPVGMNDAKDRLIALKRIGDEQIPLGYLLIANDIEKPLHRSNRSLFIQVLPSMLGILLVAIAIAFWLHHRMLSPLTRLSQFANRVEVTKDYTLRAGIKGQHEIAGLSVNIDKMMSTINQEVDKNRQHTEQLLDNQKTMERLANFDSLTGLPNRQFFMEHLRIELARASRGGTDIALIFFDLDGFKAVNDSLGHETGDTLLIEVSKRVKTYLRDGDLVSRLGGDEFLILLYNDPEELTLVAIANRIIDGLRENIDVEGWELQIGVSIGIAKARDADYNLSKFVSNADVAMYRSKMSGRATYTIFAADMMEDNKRKLQIANSFNTAINDDEFELYYQAKVSPEEKLVGFEALLRWNSKTLGFVSPAEFIPIAEQSGKIVSITHWVLERLCKELPELKRVCGVDKMISVNLSALDLKNANLYEFIQHLFEQYKVDPKWIEFEVTESAYLENFDMANRFFQLVSQGGSSIALDDFGTGYSSLSYLTRIPINTLKIDKQFVDNLGLSDPSTLVTSTIIDMAKRLQLTVCAEGVETRDQFEFLVSSGCHQLQGFLFSKPTPLSEVEALWGDNNG